MSALRYALREAIASLWRRRSASVFSVAAIGLAIVVLGGLLLVTFNVDRVVAEWSSAAELSVFLSDEVTDDERLAVETLIDGSAVALDRERVSKAQALERFRRDFAELAVLVESPEGNPFPESIELRLRPDVEGGAEVEVLAGALSNAPGVSDVRYDRQWLARVTALLTAFRRVGFGLVFVMMAAAAFTVAAVVRLALHDRRDELEIMQLVGSPYVYIRGPFVAEGVIQGGAGAAAALLVLWSGFAVAVSWWGSDLAAIGSVEGLRFLPPGTCAVLAVGGMTVGGVGGFAATRVVS
jgi:cell division transport system permease protein